MSDEPTDHWDEELRKDNEESALLSEATVAELVEIYLSSDADFDFRFVCFGALQRRPRAEVRAAGWSQLESVEVARREFGVTLLSVSARTEQDRLDLLPEYLRLLEDDNSKVVDSALQALSAAQLNSVDELLGPRARAAPFDRYNPAWENDPLPSVVDLAAIAPLICHPDSGVRNSLTHSLAFCGEADATAILLGLTWDPDEDVRAHAALGLGRPFVGGRIEPSVERLWELVEAPSPYIRVCAITALVDLGRVEAEPLVEVEMRLSLSAQDGLTCAVWPLTLLSSRRPELISAELKQLLEERRAK